MTRTTNLRLPQWVETDPVQRTDFNDAFATLDTGYAAVATATEDAQQLRQRLAGTAGNVSRMLLHGVKAELLPQSLPGVYCNPLLTEDQLPPLPDCAPYPGGGLAVGEGSKLTMAMLNDTASGFTTMEVADAGATGVAEVTFTAPLPGTITQLQVGFARTSVLTGTTVTLQAKLYDLDTDQCVYTSDTYAAPAPDNAEGSVLMPLSAPLEIRHRYRLELHKDINAAWMGKITFGSVATPCLGGVTEGVAVETTTLSLPLTAGSPAHEILVLAQTAGDGSLTVAMGETPLTLTATRSLQSLHGQPCTEQTLTLSGAVQDDVTLTLTLHATGEQSQYLYAVSAVMV